MDNGKIRITHLQIGDIIYYLGDYYRVDTISTIYQSVTCTNIYTGRFSAITAPSVILISRQLTLF